MHNFTQPQFNDYLEHLFEVTPDTWRGLSLNAKSVLILKMRHSLHRCYGLDDADAKEAVTAYVNACREETA